MKTRDLSHTDKAALRMRLKGIRMTEARIAEASRRIRDKVLSDKNFLDAETIFCYISMPGEADTSDIISEALRLGKKVCVPRISGPGQMKAVQIQEDTVLKPGPYGIPEPEDGRPEVNKADIDLAIVPCLGASADGSRLGHGGGYYDRYLQDCNAVKLCLCFRERMLDGIPMDKFDIKMDGIIYG